MNSQNVDWSRQELLRGGAILLLIFFIMYALIVIEVAMSFRVDRDGPILRLFMLRFSTYKEAGYCMMLVLTSFAMIGAGLFYYGVRWIRRGFSNGSDMV